MALLFRTQTRDAPVLHLVIPCYGHPYAAMAATSQSQQPGILPDIALLRPRTER